MLLLLFLTGCAEPEIDRAPPGPPPQERALSVDEDLKAVHQAWREEDREEAQRIARRAYREHFEPMEPFLRQEDALRTLEIEYGFGLLIASVELEDNALEVTRLVGVLRDGVSELVALAEPLPSASVATTAEDPEGKQGE